MATVYCVIPTHNRKNKLDQLLDLLNSQNYPDVQIIVVNDGSSDGTTELLDARKHNHLIVVNGDGNLWWGGAMRAGMSRFLEIACQGDYLLMLNDDVEIQSTFVSELVAANKSNGNAVAGALQLPNDTTERTNLGRGVRIHYWAMTFSECEPDSSARIDALPARGVLYPFDAVQAAGLINTSLFPHYFGDIEYSSRVRELGWPLVVADDAPIWTSAVSSDAKIDSHSLIYRYFHHRSKRNLIHRALFFSVSGPFYLRISAMPRYVVIALFRAVVASMQWVQRRF